MGLFSFGGSKSSTSSNSFGTSSSVEGSQSGSVSGGFSIGGSQNSAIQGSEQASTAQSTQGIAFEDVFAKLFGGASQAAAGLDPSMLTSAANQLFSGGTGFLQGLGKDAGTAYQQERLASSNPMLAEQIDLLGEDLGKFFNEQLLPGIASEAVGGGTLGGGRQGVAQGMAAEQVGSEFRRGAAQLRAGDMAARDQIAGQVAGQSLAGAQTGLGSLGTLMGLQQTGFGANLQPYAQLASILGGPTVLTQAGSSSFGTSFGESSGSSFQTAQDFARAFSESFGRSSSTQRSSSTGKSKSASFGF